MEEEEHSREEDRSGRGPEKISRREALKRMGKIGAGTAAGLYMLGNTGSLPASAATMSEGRPEMAKRYQNAEPGESFGFGHITWHLAQQYAIIDYQAQRQAANQLGLNFMGSVAETESAWIEQTESMIAKGAKAIHYNVPPMSVMPELVSIAEENDVFLSSHFGYTGEVFPGDFGPRWVIDNTPLSAEQTYLPLMLLMEKMKQDGRTKLLHHQASKSAATVSTVYINLGVFQAWKNYPEIELLGHQYGNWAFEGGRKAAQASLAERTDYEGLWGANDSQTTGALRALQDRGLNIGPWTASRDMEKTTAEMILQGDYLCTAGFAIPYFGGRMVPMLYDMCTGAWYPKKNEMLQAGRIDVYGKPGQAEDLAKDAGVMDHPNFALGPTKANLEKILVEMEKDNPEYPYDFRLLSRQKVEEEGLEYDRHAGGGTYLAPNSHNYYYPAKLDKFGSLQAVRDHVGALHEYFLDFDINEWERAEEYAQQFPPELKTEPIWV